MHCAHQKKILGEPLPTLQHPHDSVIKSVPCSLTVFQLYDIFAWGLKDTQKLKRLRGHIQILSGLLVIWDLTDTRYLSLSVK